LLNIRDYVLSLKNQFTSNCTTVIDSDYWLLLSDRTPIVKQGLMKKFKRK